MTYDSLYTHITVASAAITCRPFLRPLQKRTKNVIVDMSGLLRKSRENDI